MNDETALAGGFDEFADRSPQSSDRRSVSALEAAVKRASAAPRLILEIPLEGRARLRIEASSHEDALRLRRWLCMALVRRESLSAAIYKWLDALDEREAA